MGVVGATHPLEFNSLLTYPVEDRLESSTTSNGRTVVARMSILFASAIKRVPM
jgi:hypothetical protein